MKSLKKTVLSLVGASALMLSAVSPAMATYSSPDYTDVTHSLALGTITAVVGLLVNAPDTVDVSKVKIVYVEDILNGSQIANVNGILNGVLYQAQITVLKDAINKNNVLSEVLSNNDVDVKDVISVEAFEGGGLIVFCKH